jgi:hypothetical protein
MKILIIILFYYYNKYLIIKGNGIILKLIGKNLLLFLELLELCMLFLLKIDSIFFIKMLMIMGISYVIFIYYFLTISL